MSQEGDKNVTRGSIRGMTSYLLNMIEINISFELNYCYNHYPIPRESNIILFGNFDTYMSSFPLAGPT